MTKMNLHDPIDAVITWVDGSAQSHRDKRALYMAQAAHELHENAVNPHRWLCNDEILYCLHSIEHHAPWIGKIWIVVDEITPDLSRLSPSLRDKIAFSYHPEIFEGLEAVLPTFNSLAIETLLWRIKGLSERFIYFNDDVFLTATLEPSDMFEGNQPVLRGKWVDYSALEHDPKRRSDPAMFNHYMQINAAEILGFPSSRLFAAAHVAHPFLRSVMVDLWAKYPDAFHVNSAHRFRDLSQFLPQALHNHACISGAHASFQTQVDHLHIYSGQGNDGGDNEVLERLQRVTVSNEIKMLCINDLPQLEAVVPNMRAILKKVVGGMSSAAPRTSLRNKLHQNS